MKIKKEAFSLRTLLIIVILAGTAIILSIITLRSERQTARSQQPTRIANQQTQQKTTQKMYPTVDSEPEWDTYRDEAAGYEVQYPKGYVVYKYRNTGNCKFVRDDVNGNNIIFWNKDYLEGKGTNEVTDYDIRVNDPNDACVKNAYPSANGTDILHPKLVQQGTERTNDGLEILSRLYTHLNPMGTTSTALFFTQRFQKGNTYFTLQVRNGIVNNHQNIDNIDIHYNRFIESFKFVQ